MVWFELVVEPALLAAGLPEIEPLSAAKAGAAIRARAVAAPIIRLFMTIPFAVLPVDADQAAGQPWFGEHRIPIAEAKSVRAKSRERRTAN